MRRLFLVVIFYSMKSHPQVVTSSFNTISFSENPAAAGTRDFSVLSPFVSQTTSNQDIDPDANQTERRYRNVIIQRTNLFHSKKHGSFTSEIYLIQNTATKKMKVNQLTPDESSNLSLQQGFFNISLNTSNYSKFGFGLAALSFVDDVKLEDKNHTVATSQSTMSIYNMSFGWTHFFSDRFAFGTYARVITEHMKNGTWSEQDFNYMNYGLGFAYKDGGAKSNGHKVEFSLNKFGNGVEFQESIVTGLTSNAQARLSIEATKMGFTAGVTFTRTFGNYINYIYFIDSRIFESPYYATAQDSMSGFLGFKSKSGSSYGVSVGGNSGRSKITFLGNDTMAEVNEYSVGLSYAYLY